MESVIRICSVLPPKIATVLPGMAVPSRVMLLVLVIDSFSGVVISNEVGSVVPGRGDGADEGGDCTDIERGASCIEERIPGRVSL